MNRAYIVRLADGTIGEIDSDSINGQHADKFLGERIDIDCRDERGHLISCSGILVEVLEELK